MAAQLLDQQTETTAEQTQMMKDVLYSRPQRR